LYEGQFIMALATTSAVWRSTGGDQTRTATAGTMVMAAQFFISNCAATANVTNADGTQALILPAGAVVTDVSLTETGTGNIDLGFTPLTGGVGPGQTTTLGTPVPTGFGINVAAATRINITVGTATVGGASLGNVANATNLVVVTTAANSSASGNCSGIVRYFVADTGAENV
jgi:hypothetical protein